MVKKVGYGSSLHFEVLGELLIGETKGPDKWDRYKAQFGVMPNVISILFKMLSTRHNGPKLIPKHLLWTLLWLKVYPTDRVLESMLKSDRGSIKSWILHTVTAIASLKKQVVSVFFNSYFATTFTHLFSPFPPTRFVGRTG